MARGNCIVVTAEPMGYFEEGYIAAGETPKPGTILQKQSATALKGGRHTYEIYNADQDGGRPKGPFYVLLHDHLQGKTVDDAYAAGDRCFLYVPKAGDELNLLLLNIAGTADDHTKGETLIVDDTTGKLIATTGSPETEVAQLLETVTDPVADTLAWVVWTGF
jgi:hypothetical protein